MNFVTVIPTFARHETLEKKTLAYLESTNLRPSDCYLFVANEAEYYTYLNHFGHKTFKKIVVGVRGIPNQRNFIQKHFPVGTNIFMIDDDINSLEILDGKNKTRPIHDLVRLCDDSFNLCNARKIRFWGTSAVAAGFYMKQSITFDHRYIVGNVIGIVNTHDPRIMVDEGLECFARLAYTAGKESHERGVKYFINDGAIMRHNHIAPKAKYWEGDGGHQVSRNIEGEKSVTAWLAEKYPNYFKVVRRDNGMWDLKATPKRGRFAKMELSEKSKYMTY